MPIKLQIVIHLIQFALQSIIWAGTKAYIQLTLRVRLLITWPTYQPTWGKSIMLSDHRAVYDAKCGRPQSGRRGGGQRRTPADRRRGYKKGSFFCLLTSFMDERFKFLTVVKEALNAFLLSNMKTYGKWWVIGAVCPKAIFRRRYGWRLWGWHSY